MKKLLFAVALLCLCGVAKADTLPIDLGLGVTFSIPLDHADGVALWDFKSKTGLGGVETPILNYKKFTLSGGAVTSASGYGTPFARIYLDLPNPVGNFASFESLKPGLFGGRDFNRSAYIFGIAASLALW